MTSSKLMEREDKQVISVPSVQHERGIGTYYLQEAVRSLNPTALAVGASALSIETIHDGYMLKVDQSILCDCFEFQEGIEKDTGDDIEYLEKMYKLYKGRLFQDKDYPWCTYLQEVMDAHHTKLCEKLIGHFSITDPFKAELMMKR